MHGPEFCFRDNWYDESVCDICKKKGKTNQRAGEQEQAVPVTEERSMPLTESKQKALVPRANHVITRDASGIQEGGWGEDKSGGEFFRAVCAEVRAVEKACDRKCMFRNQRGEGLGLIHGNTQHMGVHVIHVR